LTHFIKQVYIETYLKRETKKKQQS